MTLAVRLLGTQTVASLNPKPLFRTCFPRFATTILHSIPTPWTRAVFPTRSIQNVSRLFSSKIPTDPNDALMKGILTVNLNQVKLALKNGANPNHKVTTCDYALHMAIGSGDLEIVRALLKAGADVNICDPDWNITPLHKAAFLGETHIVNELLQYKPNLHLRSVHCGLLPLEEAILSRNFDCCHILLNNETKFQIDLFNRKRCSTPYLEALRSGNEKIFQLFDIMRKDLSLKTPQSLRNTPAQTTPLHEAAALGLDDRVVELLEKGFDPTTLNSRAHSALDVAQLQIIALRADPKLPNKETRKKIQHLSRTVAILDVAMSTYSKKADGAKTNLKPKS